MTIAVRFISPMMTRMARASRALIKGRAIASILWLLQFYINETCPNL